MFFRDLLLILLLLFGTIESPFDDAPVRFQLMLMKLT